MSGNINTNNVLLTGLQQGKIATEIAIQLHNRMGQGFNECHRLVRTEIMHYLNDAASQRYKDAGVEYVQIWAALDERTCETCGGYHEKIYPIDKCPHVPLHANCRCTVLPVVDGVEYETVSGYLDKSSIKGEQKNLKGKMIQSGGKNITGGKWYKPYDVEDKKDNVASKEYRKISRRNDVDVIAENSGFKKEDIKQIKRHIFFNKHQKYDGYGMLYPDYDMAVAWKRLYEGVPEERDILLLRHELLESQVEKKYNLTIAEAHELAKRTYDWEAKLIEDLGEEGEPYGLL